MMLLRVLFVLAAASGGAIWMSAAARAQDAPSVAVSVRPVTFGSLPRTVQGYGVVQAGPAARAVLTIGAAGIVRTVDVTAGSAVTAGQAIATVGPDPMSLAGYRQAQAALAASIAARAHIEMLLAGRLATTDQLASATQAVSDARATLAALTSEGAGAQARIIRAPADGVVSTLAIQPGARVAAGGVVATIDRTGDAIVLVGLDAADVARTHAGDAASLRPAAGGGTLSGHVLALAGMVDPQSGLRDATVSVPGSIPLGTMLDVTITTGMVRGAKLPRDAALPDDETGGTAIFQVKDGKAVKVEVSVLASDATSSVVRGAIDPSLPVVTAGAYQLDDGMAVRVQGGS